MPPHDQRRVAHAQLPPQGGPVMPPHDQRRGA